MILWALLLGATATDEGLSLVQHAARRVPFKEALVVSIDPEAYQLVEAELRDEGVPVRMAARRHARHEAHEVHGYDARAPEDLQDALRLLTEFGNADRLHETVSRPVRGSHIKSNFMIFHAISCNFVSECRRTSHEYSSGGSF